MRAERSLLKKKMELSRIMGIAERQAQEKEAVLHYLYRENGL